MKVKLDWDSTATLAAVRLAQQADVNHFFLQEFGRKKYWTHSNFDLKMVLDEKSNYESYEDSSSGHHGYLYQISWQKFK